jgi:uncharacterized integral membrane protein
MLNIYMQVQYIHRIGGSSSSLLRSIDGSQFNSNAFAFASGFTYELGIRSSDLALALRKGSPDKFFFLTRVWLTLTLWLISFLILFFLFLFCNCKSAPLPFASSAETWPLIGVHICRYIGSVYMHTKPHCQVNPTRYARFTQRASGDILSSVLSVELGRYMYIVSSTRLLLLALRSLI